MQKRKIHKDPIRTPRGKRTPLAIDVFAEKAAMKQRDNEIERLRIRTERKQDLKDLKTEVLEARGRSNQDHFAFATGIIAGGGVANFLALQIDGPTTLYAKAVLAFTMGTFLWKINKTFFFNAGVYKEMLREVNKLNEQLRAEDLQIPSFKELFDKSTGIRKSKIDSGEKTKTLVTRRVANSAVVIIAGLTISNIVATAFQDNKNEESKLTSEGEAPVVKPHDPAP